MKKNINFLPAVFFAILLLGTWIVLPGSEAYAARDIIVAQADGTDAPSGRRHHGPPPEAISACAGLSDGDMCSFTSRRETKLEGHAVLRGMGILPVCPKAGLPGKEEICRLRRLMTLIETVFTQRRLKNNVNFCL